MKFGIVGFGRFGKLWAQALSSFGEVLVYDKSGNLSDNTKIQMTTLPEVANADVIFIIVPISQFEECCLELNKYISPKAVVIDCCSVKTHPVQVMRKIFSKQQSLVATHPLFGPDSVSKSGGMTNHQIVVCAIQCDEIKLEQVNKIFQGMGLNIITATPEEHDKQMANSQGLVHFIGRGLAALQLHPQELATPDFQALLNINKMVVNDSWQLFLDMHKYNPYTKSIRNKFIKQLAKIDEEVNKNVN